MNPTIQQCYLCGTGERITRDHIPPQCLFSKPKPDDLITVPCCYDCNHSFHKKDELLRLLVSAAFNRNEQGDVIWEKVIDRTIKRKRLSDKVRELAKSVSIKELDTPHGILRKAHVTIPQEELSDSLIRIVKGLLYHHAPSISRNELNFNIVQVDQTRLNELLDPFIHTMPLHRIIGNGTFRYWAGLATEDNRGGMWVLMFYDSTAFSILHKPKDVEHKPPEGRGAAPRP